MKIEQSFPKRRHISFRRRGITQNKAYNIQYMTKVWNKVYVTFCGAAARLRVGVTVCWGSEISHTIRHIGTNGRSPPNEWPARPICRYQYTTHNKTKKRFSMCISRFKPAIPRKKPMQNYTFNRSATEIDIANMGFCHCNCADSRM
jgi:hypothetical protein